MPFLKRSFHFYFLFPFDYYHLVIIIISFEIKRGKETKVFLMTEHIWVFILDEPQIRITFFRKLTNSNDKL